MENAVSLVIQIAFRSARCAHSVVVISMTAAHLVQSKQAVIFDLFHTLTGVEQDGGGGLFFTHELLGVDAKEWDHQLHACSRARLAGEMRDPFQIIATLGRTLRPELTDDEIRHATENRIKRFAAALRHIPPSNIAVLSALRARGQKLGLISNADAMEAAAWPESPARDLFHSTLFSCDVGFVKPEPEIYRRSLDELGVPAKEAVFVGDGGSFELEGARSMGLATIQVIGVIEDRWPERIAENKPHADFVIRDLTELC